MTLVGFCVISRWPLTGFLSHHKKRHSYDSYSIYITIFSSFLQAVYPVGVTDLRPYFMQIFGHNSVKRRLLIPTLMGYSPPNDTIRKLFALPPRYGGLGIINPTLITAEEYSASCHITESLSQFILDRGTNSAIVKIEQLSRKSAIRNSKSSNYSDRSSSLRTHLDPSSQRALDLASAKGASNWLTTRPLQ